MTATSKLYGASTVKRVRSTNAELEALDEAIVTAVTLEHPVSVRGVFYRVVSAGAVEKTENGYRKVGRQLLKLRRAGTVSYNWITDGTRLRYKSDSWDDMDAMLGDAAASYRRALWADQHVEVIILSEKEAISGAVFPVTDEWDVELCIARGYSSETFSYTFAETIAAAGKPVYLYQLGDHDPSGVDAWRSFERTVRGFDLGGDAYFQRIAVTPEQIVELDLPTRPTKTSDSRSAKFDGESVEVDAIAPTRLRQIVTEAITQHIDQRALALTRSVEQSEKDLLVSLPRFAASQEPDWSVFAPDGDDDTDEDEQW
jgi:hypothetical protein